VGEPRYRACFETSFPTTTVSIFTLPCATGLAKCRFRRPKPLFGFDGPSATLRASRAFDALRSGGGRRTKRRYGLFRPRISRSPVRHRWRYHSTNRTTQVTRRAFAHRFQCLVIQEARIAVFLAPSESRGIRTAKKNIDLYPVHVGTRKSLGLMTWKLSVTELRKLPQFLGTLPRKKSRVAPANCPHVAWHVLGMTCQCMRLHGRSIGFKCGQ
jgi:hypothetical protein